MAPAISQAAIDLIVSCEVSSKAYYERHYEHPEWPGGASGVTIAIGYDCGYASVAKIRSDWTGRIPDRMVRALEQCSGVTGERARAKLSQVHFVEVPWDKAIEVFSTIDMPDWIARVCRAIPGADKLPSDCLGALVSLAYNRGASFTLSGSRYAEMRAIRAHVVAGDLDKVPGDIRAMKRLWPNMRGLRDRRDAEAALFAKGLRAPTVTPARAPARPLPPPQVKEAPPPALPPVAPKPPAGAVTGTGAVGTAGAVAASQSHSGWIVAAVVLATITVCVAIYLIHRKRNAEPATARAKDDGQEIPAAA